MSDGNSVRERDAGPKPHIILNPDSSFESQTLFYDWDIGTLRVVLASPYQIRVGRDDDVVPNTYQISAQGVDNGVGSYAHVISDMNIPILTS